MDHAVMPVTQEDQVGKVGLPTMNPVHDVMRRSPGCRPIASWPDTATISDLERLALRGRHDPLRAPDVDDHGLGVEKDASNAAAARQPWMRSGARTPSPPPALQIDPGAFPGNS